MKISENQRKRMLDMTREETFERLEHAKRKFFLNINGVPVAILVDDKDKNDIVAACFEVSEYSVNAKGVEIHVPMTMKRIEDEEVRGYADMMLFGIIETLKNRD